MHTVLSIQRKQNLKDWLLLLKSVIVLLIYYFWLHFHAGKCQLLQCIFQTENADKALKYRLYRHLPAYEKIIRNLVSFFIIINYYLLYFLYIFSNAGMERFIISLSTQYDILTQPGQPKPSAATMSTSSSFAFSQNALLSSSSAFTNI